MATTKTCLNCGGELKSNQPNQKYCNSKGMGVCKKEYTKKKKAAEKKAKLIKQVAERQAKLAKKGINLTTKPIICQAEEGQFNKAPKVQKNEEIGKDFLAINEKIEAQLAEKKPKQEVENEVETKVEPPKVETKVEKTLEMLENVHLEAKNEVKAEKEVEKPLEMLETMHLEAEKEVEQLEVETEVENEVEQIEEQEEEEEAEQDDDVFDLSEHLAQPTKDKTINPDLEEEEEQPPLDNEDFDQEQVEQIEEQKSKNLSVSRDLETDAVKVMMAPKKAAKVSISFLSAINDLALPFIHKKASFTKTEESHLKNLARLSKQKKLAAFSNEDRALLDKWDEHEEYKELVPWDEEEKEDLAIPLEELFKGTDGKGMSPFWALMIVLITILSSRLIPVGQAYAKRGKGDLKYLAAKESDNEPKNQAAKI